MKFISWFTVILMTSSVTIAQMPAAKPTPSPTPKHMGPNAYTPIEAPKPSKTEGLENNGQVASKKQGQGGAAAAAAAAAMAAIMAATCPACAIRGTCPTCIASTIGLGASMQTGSEMDRAQGLSNTQVNQVNPTATPGVKPAFTSSPAYKEAIKDLEKATKGTGVKISSDFKTVTTPDGRTIDVSKALSGGGGLTGGELSLLKGHLKTAQDVAQKAAAKAHDGSSGEEISGGGGGSGVASSDNSEIGSGVPVSGSQARSPANVAGTYKDLNGDRIGVAVDSVFEMMHRRYRASSEREYFMRPEN